jgi:hypothetical protein
MKTGPIDGALCARRRPKCSGEQLSINETHHGPQEAPPRFLVRRWSTRVAHRGLTDDMDGGRWRRDLPCSTICSHGSHGGEIWNPTATRWVGNGVGILYLSQARKIQNPTITAFTRGFRWPPAWAPRGSSSDFCSLPNQPSGDEAPDGEGPRVSVQVHSRSMENDPSGPLVGQREATRVEWAERGWVEMGQGKFWPRVRFALLCFSFYDFLFQTFNSYFKFQTRFIFEFQS